MEVFSILGPLYQSSCVFVVALIFPFPFPVHQSHLSDLIFFAPFVEGKFLGHGQQIAFATVSTSNTGSSTFTLSHTLIYMWWSSFSSSLCLFFTSHSALLFSLRSSLLAKLFLICSSWYSILCFHRYSFYTPLLYDLLSPLWSTSFLSTWLHSTPLNFDQICSLPSALSVLVVLW